MFIMLTRTHRRIEENDARRIERQAIALAKGEEQRAALTKELNTLEVERRDFDQILDRYKAERDEAQDGHQALAEPFERLARELKDIETKLEKVSTSRDFAEKEWKKAGEGRDQAQATRDKAIISRDYTEKRRKEAIERRDQAIKEKDSLVARLQGLLRGHS